MRAATNIGLTFVGAGSGSVSRQKQSDDSEFVPHIIAPDKEYQALKSACAKALVDRVTFWQEELMTWTAEFGASAVEKLREQIDE